MNTNDFDESGITYKEIFDYAFGETLESDFTEKQLDDILNSESFEMTIRALGGRNPYFARHIFRHLDIMSTIQRLCVIANHVNTTFESHIKETYDVSLDEYEKTYNQSLDDAKMEYYGEYLIDDEPMPLSYEDVIDLLNDSSINVTPEQDEKLRKQLSPFTDEECEDLIKRCRQAPEVFGWCNREGEPLCES